MSRVIFEDLPSTNTPINAENLNNNFEKNICRAKTNEEYTTTSSNVEKLPLVQNINIGTKLSVSNGNIIIGEGVNYIKASAQAIFSSISGVNERHAIYIYKNNINNLTAQSRLSGTWESLQTGVIFMSVNSGDYISLYVRTQDGTGAKISDGAMLTVEVVE